VAVSWRRARGLCTPISLQDDLFNLHGRGVPSLVGAVTRQQGPEWFAGTTYGVWVGVWLWTRSSRSPKFGGIALCGLPCLRRKFRSRMACRAATVRRAAVRAQSGGNLDRNLGGEGWQATSRSGSSRKYRGGSLRLRGYDYVQVGAYAVTIRTRGGEPLFGEVVDGRTCPNACGQIAQNCCAELPVHFDHARVDTCLVMPNHFHAIIVLLGQSPASGSRAAWREEQFGKPVRGSLPTMMRSLKSAVSKAINELRGTPGESVWQRGYYEHVIRDERELNEHRRYILENLLRWSLHRDV
jgi:putative transposase